MESQQQYDDIASLDTLAPGEVLTFSKTDLNVTIERIVSPTSPYRRWYTAMAHRGLLDAALYYVTHIFLGYDRRNANIGKINQTGDRIEVWTSGMWIETPLEDVVDLVLRNNATITSDPRVVEALGPLHRDAHEKRARIFTRIAISNPNWVRFQIGLVDRGVNAAAMSHSAARRWANNDVQVFMRNGVRVLSFADTDLAAVVDLVAKNPGYFQAMEEQNLLHVALIEATHFHTVLRNRNIYRTNLEFSKILVRGDRGPIAVPTKELARQVLRNNVEIRNDVRIRHFFTQELSTCQTLEYYDPIMYTIRRGVVHPYPSAPRPPAHAYVPLCLATTYTVFEPLAVEAHRAVALEGTRYGYVILKGVLRAVCGVLEVSCKRMWRGLETGGWSLYKTDSSALFRDAISDFRKYVQARIDTGRTEAGGTGVTNVPYGTKDLQLALDDLDADTMLALVIDAHIEASTT